MNRKHPRDRDMSPEAIERRIKEVFMMRECCRKLSAAVAMGPVERSKGARRADPALRAPAKRVDRSENR